MTNESRELDRATNEDIQKVFALYKQKGDQISDFLINRITTVDVRLARNVIGDFSSLKQMV